MKENLKTLAQITLKIRRKYIQCVERKNLYRQKNESLSYVYNGERLGYMRILQEIRDMVGYPLGILLREYRNYNKGELDPIDSK